MQKSKRAPARYVALAVRYLEDQGVDCAEPLKKAGIRPASLQHTEAELPEDQLNQAVRLLMQASGGLRENALAIGAMLGPGQFGELGRAMQSCSTVRDGIELCSRYYELVTPSFSMHTRQLGLYCEISWQPIEAVPYDVMLVAFDLAAMCFHTRMQTLLRDELPAYDIYFSSPRPQDEHPYKALRPARCHFGQGGLPSLRIVIDADVLSRTSMPMANAFDLAQAELRLASRLRSKTSDRDWRAWVDMMLNEAHEHQPTQDELAALVGLSGSTLARHLAAQGESFRAMANRIRHERACRMLSEGKLLIADIGRLLGYTDSANFGRAFKAKAGLTPAQYAENHKALG